MESKKRVARKLLMVALAAASTIWNINGFSASSLGTTRPSAGIFGGFSGVSQGIGSANSFGAKFSTPAGDTFSAGGYFSYLNKGLLDTSTKVWVLAPEATFHLDYYVPGLGLGLKAGLEWVDTSPNTDKAGTYFVLGPHLYYDFPVSDNFTVGAEANGIFPFSDTAVTMGNFLGVLKMWF